MSVGVFWLITRVCEAVEAVEGGLTMLSESLMIPRLEEMHD